MCIFQYMAALIKERGVKVREERQWIIEEAIKIEHQDKPVNGEWKKKKGIDGAFGLRSLLFYGFVVELYAGYHKSSFLLFLLEIS